MNYLRVKDIASIWNVVPALVSNLCKNGKIDGAYKYKKEWMIPENARKPTKTRQRKERTFKFIDLFCGIGGFHQAMKKLGGECVFACDISLQCREVYDDEGLSLWEILLESKNYLKNDPIRLLKINKI